METFRNSLKKLEEERVTTSTTNRKPEQPWTRDGVGGTGTGTNDEVSDGSSFADAEEMDLTERSGIASNAGANANAGSDRLALERKLLVREKENQRVQWIRRLILLVLIAATVGVCALVYFYSRGDEIQDFERHYADYANKLLESVHSSLKLRLGALDMYSIDVTAYAQAVNATFPMVTIPSFSVKTAAARVQSSSVIIGYFPVIWDDRERDQWQDYCSQITNETDFLRKEAYHDYELRANQDFDLMDLDEPLVPWKEEDTEPFRPFVFETVTDDNGTKANVERPYNNSPYVVRWQMSPERKRATDLRNKDYMTAPSYKNVMKRVLDTSKATFNKAKLHTNASAFNQWILHGQYRHDEKEYGGGALTQLLYPVFDGFDTDTRKMVGILVSHIYFRVFFANILPQNSHGIQIVVQNTFNQTYTYQIDGPIVTFMGEGDFHDPHFDHLMISTDLVEILQQQKQSTSTSSYTVVGLDGEYCSYQLRIYPSQATKDDYTTSQPFVGAIVIAVVFVVTAASFFLYDILVERRQKTVMDKAVASGAIVSSLFPEQFKDQLYSDQKKNNKQDATAASSGGGGLAAFHTKNVPQLSADGDIEAPLAAAQEPSHMAESYPDCSVFFADIVGFTAWSAQRTPGEVFTLLETIYAAWDKVARKHGIFKIETIGDCYLAVCGLPKPNPNHAIQVTKFARDCLLQMARITAKLDAQLDTSALAIRVGLHSGPVTAGVLRGEKARFQVFGDSVNTASRMESNGEPNRIHCSEETAKLLAAAGKEQWIIPREDKIFAKGKGELQTFWVHPSSTPSLASAISGVTDASSLRKSARLNITTPISPSPAVPPPQESADTLKSRAVTSNEFEDEDLSV
ncbi:Receptor-type guanylate cyclase gcy [Seminavis robusta]|uniref:Receptor-type guanylate cyclase gcy n=1 Tax=Seminavis robusta TaxID=568900 RepID=A0A9N8H2E8_9STRA|nr:Receptor-type guanylate cyclase gcy [Seminavis robusta]|eukprot:Sro34_g022140.1 Receptor-type guanylate cyclase gcy (859) ;mRNA; r:149755-152910